MGYVVPGFFAEESRLVFPGGVGEAAASSALGNKVLRPRPCCSGAHSDAGARSGREEPPVPGGELLCWSEDAAAAVGLADGRRVDRARVSPDDGRRRALVQIRRSLGRDPGRRAIGDAFISSVWVSVYFDSSQSLMAMELRRSWGRRQAGDGVRRAAGEIALWRIRDAAGPRGLFVIFFVSKRLVCKTAVLCILSECICICTGLCTVFLTLIQSCSDKKNSSTPEEVAGASHFRALR